MLLGVDVGGTFTDAVLFDGRAVHTAKAPTTPADQSTGVLAAVDAVLGAPGRAAEVEAFAHGMTVGTNALLEERGARTALVATAGFTDLLEIGRQNRPHLYRLCAPKPAPLVAGELASAPPSASGPRASIEPLDDGGARPAGRARSRLRRRVGRDLPPVRLRRARARGTARRARSARRCPEVHVSASHEVLPQFREYERCSTTVIDAYLSPLLRTLPARPGRRGRRARACRNPS